MQQIGDLILGDRLGGGSYGVVLLSKNINSNILYATKKILKPQNAKKKEYLQTEINIMNDLNHENVIKLIELKMDNNYYYLVMEFANGGDLGGCLQKYIKKNGGRGFPEEIVQYLMRQIVGAVEYIHSRNIIHRDLKLGNIMVNFDSDIDKQNLDMMKAKIKIGDFGVSKYAKEAFTDIGTANYMDPMILEEHVNKEKIDILRPYSQEVDIWSLGCLCYELYMGELLFKNKYKDKNKNKEAILEQIKIGKYNLHKNVSPELKDFLSRMIQYDGKFRLTAKELLSHPFLTRDPKDFNKFPINLPKKSEVFNSKDSIYPSQINLDIGIQYPNQPVTTIYTQDQNTGKFVTINDDNTNTNKNTANKTLKSYYGDYMTSNSESKIQTTNSQLGQNPFLQQYNFHSHLPPSPYQEENNIEDNFNI